MILSFIADVRGHSPVFGITTFHAPKNKFLCQLKQIYWDANDGHDFFIRNTFGYGFTERLTVDAVMPYFITRRAGCDKSSGISDTDCKFNCSVFNKKTDYDQIDVILFDLIRFPTGDARATPALGTGVYRDRLGIAVDYDTDRFGIFTATGYELSCNAFQGIRPGGLFEISATLEAKPSHVTAFVGEIDFYTQQKRTVHGVKDPDSGGTILYVGPSFYYKNEHLKVDACFQAPVFREKLNQGVRFGFFIKVIF